MVLAGAVADATVLFVGVGAFFGGSAAPELDGTGGGANAASVGGAEALVGVGAAFGGSLSTTGAAGGGCATLPDGGPGGPEGPGGPGGALAAGLGGPGGPAGVEDGGAAAGGCEGVVGVCIATGGGDVDCDRSSTMELGLVGGFLDTSGGFTT